MPSLAGDFGLFVPDIAAANAVDVAALGASTSGFAEGVASGVDGIRLEAGDWDANSDEWADCTPISVGCWDVGIEADWNESGVFDLVGTSPRFETSDALVVEVIADVDIEDEVIVVTDESVLLDCDIKVEVDIEAEVKVVVAGKKAVEEVEVLTTDDCCVFECTVLMVWIVEDSVFEDVVEIVAFLRPSRSPTLVLLGTNTPGDEVVLIFFLGGEASCSCSWLVPLIWRTECPV